MRASWTQMRMATPDKHSFQKCEASDMRFSHEAVLSLALAVVLALCGGQAKAGFHIGSSLPSSGSVGADPMFTFTLSGPVTGYGILNAISSGHADDSLWATSGSFTLT